MTNITKYVYLALASLSIVSILGNATMGNFQGCGMGFCVLLILAIVGFVYRIAP